MADLDELLKKVEPDSEKGNTQDEKATPDTQRKLSFGERLVGLTFNPSGDEKVNRAKQLCAELADLVQEHVVDSNRETTQLEQLLHAHVMGEILNAQMNAVKILTLKY